MYVTSSPKKNFVSKVNAKPLGMRYDGGAHSIAKEYGHALLSIKHLIIKFVSLPTKAQHKAFFSLTVKKILFKKKQLKTTENHMMSTKVIMVMAKCKG